jgi:hypothetical protein
MSTMERTVVGMINPWLLERIVEDRQCEMLGTDRHPDIPVESLQAATTTFTYGALAVIDGTGPIVQLPRRSAPLSLRARLGWSLVGLGARLARS